MALRLETSSIGSNVCDSAKLFSSERLCASSTFPAGHRKRSIRCALPEFSVSLSDGLGGSAHWNLIELSESFLQRGSALELPWWWIVFGTPVALSYLLATPGSLAGLADFLYAPIHVRSMRSFSAEEVEIGRQLGEGSFGVVYEGFIGRSRKVSKSEGLHVVLKKAKTRVKGVSEIHNSEIYMNQRLQRTASFACAEFLGTLQVTPANAHGKLSEGTWLVWNFQGDRSLDYYLKQRSFPENLISLVQHKASSDAGVYKQSTAVIKMIFKQILENLQDLHRSGVVHRDVKPLNLILDQNHGSFKLIDFGACVDLRSGFNYIPNETVIDPTYAAPEHYVMPVSTPNLPPDPLCSLVSPLLWLLNTPDRFDLYSAGLILMQLSLKSLRQNTAMQAFNAELKRSGYNLNKWRASCHHGKNEFALLDADGGAGWELASALLQPRHDKDQIIWPSLGSSRPSASAALRHRFFEGSATLPKILSLPDLASRVIPAFEGVALSLSSFYKKEDNSSLKEMDRPLLQSDKKKNMNGKVFSFPSMPTIPFSSNAVTLDRRQNRPQDSQSVDFSQLSNTSTTPKPSFASKADQELPSYAAKLKDSTSHVLRVALKGRKQEADGLNTETVAQQRTPRIEKNSDKKESSSVSSVATQGAPVFAPVESALPKLATSAVALATGWLVFSGLNSSAQASYEFGKLLMSSTGVSGSAFLTFFLVIKPWFEDHSLSFGKTKDDKVSIVNEHQKDVHVEKYRYTQSEQIKVQAVADSVRELDLQMTEIEAQLLEEHHRSDQHTKLVQRLEDLLLKPVTRG